MTAPADAGLPDPAAPETVLAEPASPEPSLPEPAIPAAGLAQAAPSATGLAQAAPPSTGLPETATGPAQPAVPAAAPAQTAPRDRGTPPAPADGEQHLRGHYAGFASRFIAFIVDCVVSVGVFMIVLSAASYAASVLTGTSIHWNRGNTWVVIAFFAWEFVYFAYFWAGSGKTPGMLLLGVQVVGEDGSHAGGKRGLVRTLAFPLSFILLGLGFLGILLGRDRRALHDVIAGTAVVYCWDAREARLRSLARQGGQPRP
jgi:uncharacterized RDD family membrane protein YckC